MAPDWNPPVHLSTTGPHTGWSCNLCGSTGYGDYRTHRCGSLSADDVRRIVREELIRLHVIADKSDDL